MTYTQSWIKATITPLSSVYINSLLGIQKIKRDNGTLTQWSTHFVRTIIDTPVYYGKIAFGRRTREKVKGFDDLGKLFDVFLLFFREEALVDWSLDIKCLEYKKKNKSLQRRKNRFK